MDFLLFESSTLRAVEIIVVEARSGVQREEEGNATQSHFQ